MKRRWNFKPHITAKFCDNSQRIVYSVREYPTKHTKMNRTESVWWRKAQDYVNRMNAANPQLRLHNNELYSII